MLRDQTIKRDLAIRNLARCQQTFNNMFAWVVKSIVGKEQEKALYLLCLEDARQGVIGFRAVMVNTAHEVNLLQSDLDAYQITCEIEHNC